MSKKNNYDKELLRGLYPLLILKLLKGYSPQYGYQIEKNVRILSNSNFVITEGSLYPILHKLEEKGLIKSHHKEINNRIRKYYSITKKGINEFESQSSIAIDVIENFKAFIKLETS